MNPQLLNARNAQPKRPAIQLGNITIVPGSAGVRWPEAVIDEFAFYAEPGARGDTFWQAPKLAVWPVAPAPRPASVWMACLLYFKLLGYTLGQAVAAFVALLYAGLKWPFAAVVKAWRNVSRCHRCKVRPCYLFGECQECVSAALSPSPPHSFSPSPPPSFSPSQKGGPDAR